MVKTYHTKYLSIRKEDVSAGAPKAEGSLNRFNWTKPNSAMQALADRIGLWGNAKHPRDLGHHTSPCYFVQLYGSFGTLTA